MGMNRLLEYLDYVNEWPPAHVVLGLVHRPEDQRPARPTTVSASQEARDLQGLAGALGAHGRPSAVPAELRALAEQAKKVQAALKERK
jgi:hypothetical protein